MVETTEFLKKRRSVLARNMTAPGPDDAQLRELLSIAARVPDHGKLAPWRFVVLQGDDRAKLGGIAMPINGFGWHRRTQPASSDELVAATGRYHRKAIELFGPERCMFESNFPVDKRSCSYAVVWNAFKKIAAEFSAADQAHLFHDTAVQAYRL